MLSSRDADRFLSKVRFVGGCWVWQAGHLSTGYPSFSLGGGSQPGHRVSFASFVGPIPSGGFVLHRCDNRSCVNPDHLYLGDHRRNMRDMRERGRSASGERNGQSHLSDEQRREIADRFEPRYTRYVAGKGARRWRSNRIELAAEFGVSTTTISNITKGNTYAA